jgi:hypothetical protein
MTDWQILVMLETNGGERRPEYAAMARDRIVADAPLLNRGSLR